MPIFSFRLEKNWLQMRLVTVTNDVHTVTDACTFNSAKKKIHGGEKKRRENLCKFAYLICSLFLHLLHLRAAFSLLHSWIKACVFGESSNKLLLMFPYTVRQTQKPLFKLTDKLQVVLLHLEGGVFRTVHAACLSGLPAWVVHRQWNRGGRVELKVETLPHIRLQAMISPDHYFEWWVSHAPSEVGKRTETPMFTRIWTGSRQTPETPHHGHPPPLPPQPCAKLSEHEHIITVGRDAPSLAAH